MKQERETFFSRALFQKKEVWELLAIEASYLKAVNQVTPHTGAMIVQALGWIRDVLKEKEYDGPHNPLRVLKFVAENLEQVALPCLEAAGVVSSIPYCLRVVKETIAEMEAKNAAGS
jgi:hypothetical protein